MSLYSKGMRGHWQAVPVTPASVGWTRGGFEGYREPLRTSARLWCDAEGDEEEFYSVVHFPGIRC